MRHALVCHDVAVGARASVGKNCVLACGVRVMEGVSVSEGIYLCVAEKPDDGADDDDDGRV